MSLVRLKSTVKTCCALYLLCVGLNALAQDTSPFTNVGAAQFERYLPLLDEQRVGLVVNQTSHVSQGHLVDVLLDKGVNITRIFAPEHGFRGNRGAGESIADSHLPASKIPISSLYGKTKKPTAQMLSDVDILVFDIQDVGVRFYTYISTMHYVLEAAAEHNKKVIILDRPNPNGQHIAGPILEPALQSFVGMHPIPIVHGLTVGELALAIKGEGWIAQASELDLRVIPVLNYHKQDAYTLPIPPSPNLPNQRAITAYASLCLFEPTTFSIGRGTVYPFQMLGHPELASLLTEPALPLSQIMPVSMPTSAPSPKWQDQNISALVLDETMTAELAGFNLKWVVNVAQHLPDQAWITSPRFFDKLAGTATLRESLDDPVALEALAIQWEREINVYVERMAPYRLYPF
jgi:uncharacterized protein YbbC (DUF1343 family)